MKVTIALKGTLKKLFEGDTERVFEVPDNCTCDEALQAAGINSKETRHFGFVSVNNKSVMIDSRLSDVD